MSPNHIPTDLIPCNVLFSSTLLKYCPFSEKYLEAASSVSSVLLVESLFACTIQAVPSLKEMTACLSSVFPMVPSHIGPDLQHVIGPRVLGLEQIQELATNTLKS